LVEHFEKESKYLKIQVLENKKNKKFSDKKDLDDNNNNKDSNEINDSILSFKKKNTSFGRLPDRYRSRKEELVKIPEEPSNGI